MSEIMTFEDACMELLSRSEELQGAPLFIRTVEFDTWPPDVVEEMKKKNIIYKVVPSPSAACTGCEEECVMPVHSLQGGSGKPRRFIFCGKRNDTARVEVEESQIERWLVLTNVIEDLWGG